MIVHMAFGTRCASVSAFLEVINRLRRTLQQRLAVDCSLEATIFWLMLRYAAEGKENWFLRFSSDGAHRVSENGKAVPKLGVSSSQCAMFTQLRQGPIPPRTGVKLRERANRIRSLIPEGEEPHFLIPLLPYA